MAGDLTRIPKTADDVSILHYESALGWKCSLCRFIAIRSGMLEQQSFDHYGPYFDKDYTVWLQCKHRHCKAQFHARCTRIDQDLIGALWVCPICKKQN